ncbi:MAG: hypothetical protein HOG49_21460 [Candidatus Scalindua sp.]|jgi:ribosome modulation factor|nr:hypothetical protein [Candidatus Scalindua sp.]
MDIMIKITIFVFVCVLLIHTFYGIYNNESPHQKGYEDGFNGSPFNDSQFDDIEDSVDYLQGYREGSRDLIN